MMDNESGDSMELMEEVPLRELGEAELERLVWNSSIIHTIFTIITSVKVLVCIIHVNWSACQFPSYSRLVIRLWK